MNNRLFFHLIRPNRKLRANKNTKKLRAKMNTNKQNQSTEAAFTKIIFFRVSKSFHKRLEGEIKRENLKP